MGYEKGRLARKHIVEAGARVLLAKGFSATTTADLAHAAQTTTGKLTHHFPTKAMLLEAAFQNLMMQFETGPLARLSDNMASPKDRIFRFFDEVYRVYSEQTGLVGCPLGHAAGDLEDVPPLVKQSSLKFLTRVTLLLQQTFRELKMSPSASRAKASLFVNAWQGAVVITRAGAGLEHVYKVFRLLKEDIER